MKKTKGYVLLITIIITFFLTITTITCFTVVYRYQNILKNKINDLQETVNPTSETNEVLYDIYIGNI